MVIGFSFPISPAGIVRVVRVHSVFLPSIVLCSERFGLGSSFRRSLEVAIEHIAARPPPVRLSSPGPGICRATFWSGSST